MSFDNIAAQPSSSRNAQRQGDAPRLRSAVILPPAAIAPGTLPFWESHDLRSQVGKSFYVASVEHGRPSEKHAKEFLPSSSPWIVDDIPNVPSHFPIEKTHAVLTDTSPSVISDRITACLRDRSIAAVYDDENALCLAETRDFVKFYVRLFKCKCDNHDGVDGVLVEVQRRCGGSVGFHEAARAILRAAKGLPAEVDKARPTLSESFLARAREFKCCSKLPNLKVPLQVEEETISALEVADCLLHKDRLDANLLGMESLKFLTDAKLSGTKTATLVAIAILNGNDEGLGIKDAVMSLIYFRNLNGNDSDGDCDVEIETNRIMHTHALAVLANSIALLTNEDETKASAILTGLCHDELLATLTKELVNAEVRPNEAYEATRCLNGLIAVSSDVKSRAACRGAPSLVKDLLSRGVCRHALLERELDNTFELFTDLI